VKNTESTATTTQNRINTHNNVGWNAVRAPSHAEGTKATLSFLFFLSFFLSDDVFVFLSSFYDNERCWFFPTNVFRRRLVKYRSALTSLSDLNLLFKTMMMMMYYHT
jgi:hypothetical protein